MCSATGFGLRDVADVDPEQPHDLALDLFQSKLDRPWARPGLVVRQALVERLLAEPAPIVAVVAPAGYGKTTLLAQWSAADERPSAWVSLDALDNDPARFVGYIATALDRLEPVQPDHLSSLTTPAAYSAAALLHRFASIVASRRKPFTLVLDHLEVIDDQRCRDAVAELAAQLPTGSRLAIASRAEPPLPLGNLRARGQVMELGAADLAMGAEEAQALLAGAEASMSPSQVAELVLHTEGWPVGLYLAALASRTGPPSPTGMSFAGDDRVMADYLGSEVLSGLSEDTRQFLMRTSVLERLSGPLCDAVLGTPGSQHVLEVLEQSNLLLVPLDRTREWYRYHHLFRELLSAELLRTEPGTIPRLHDRAAGWFESVGLEELAVDHALLAGDTDRAARLVSGLANKLYSSGRVNTVAPWLRWFEATGTIERYPQVAMLAALHGALAGRPATVERWAETAERGRLTGLLPDSSPIEAWLNVLRSCLCRHGAEQMLADAELAVSQLGPSSPFRAGAAAFAGFGAALAGDDAAADVLMARAHEVATGLNAMATIVFVEAERAALAIARRDWAEAETHARRAVELQQERHLDEYVSAVLVHAVAARLAVHRGNVTAARDHVARGSRLRPMCTFAFPATTLFLLELAQACMELSDPAGARAILRQVRDILQLRPDLGAVPQRMAELKARLDVSKEGAVGASSLTAAELKLLPFLATHLSFPEIAERLHLSRHTVKTQAISLYRKVGATSRSEAVQLSEEIGLLRL